VFTRYIIFAIFSINPSTYFNRVKEIKLILYKLKIVFGTVVDWIIIEPISAEF